MAGKSYNVGTATIKVRPDLTGFRRDLRTQINRQKAHVEVETELDKKSLQEEKEKVRRADFSATVDLDFKYEWKKLKTKIEAQSRLDRPKISVEIAPQHRSVERYLHGYQDTPVRLKPDFKQLRADIAEWNAKGRRPTVWVDVAAATAGARAKIATLTRPEKKTVYVDVDVTAFDMAANQLASRLNRVGNMVGRLQFIAGALTAIGVGAAGAVPEISTFGRELGIAAQSALVLPAALTAIGAAAGAGYLALSRFSDHLSDVSEKAAGMQIMPEGMEKLDSVSSDMEFVSKATHEAALSFARFGDAWKTTQGSIEDGFFRGMAEEFEKFANVHLPLLQNQLSGISASFGGMVRGWMEFRSSAQGTADLNAQLGNTNMMFGSMVRGVNAFGRAWNDIATVGSQFLPSFGAWFTRISNDFANWASSARETGRMAELMQRGFEAVANVGKLIGGTFGLLGDVLGVAAKNADELSQHMIRTLTSTREWAQSLEGQEKIAKFFDDASRTGEEFMRIIGAIGELIAEHLAPAMAEFMEGFGPRFTRLIDSFAPILDAITPTMEQIGSAMGDLLLGTQAMGIAFTPLIYTILPAATAAFRALAPAIGGLAAPITTMIALTLAMKKIEPFFAAFAAFSTRPWGPLVLGISAASAAIAGLYVTFEPFRNVLDTIVDGIKAFNDSLGGVPGRIAIITASVAAVSIAFRRLKNALASVDMANLMGPGGKLRNNLTPMESMRASYANFMGTLQKYEAQNAKANASDKARGAAASSTASRIVAANNTVYASNERVAASNAKVAASSERAASAAARASMASAGAGAGAGAAGASMTAASVARVHAANVAAIESAKQLNTVNNRLSAGYVKLRSVLGGYAQAARTSNMVHVAALTAAADSYDAKATQIMRSSERMGSGLRYTMQAASLHTVAFARRGLNPLVGAFGAVKGAGAAAFGGIRKAASGLFSLIGGGWGAAMIGGIVLVQQFAEALERTKKSQEITLDLKIKNADGAKSVLDGIADGAERLTASTAHVESFGESLKGLEDTNTGWVDGFFNGINQGIARNLGGFGAWGDKLWEVADRSQQAMDAQNKAADAARGYADALKHLGMNAEDVARVAASSEAEWEAFMEEVAKTPGYTEGVGEHFEDIRATIQRAIKAAEEMGPAGIAMSEGLKQIGQGGEEAEKGLMAFQRGLMQLKGVQLDAIDAAEQFHSQIEQLMNNSGEYAGAQLTADGQLDVVNSAASSALAGDLLALNQSMHQLAISTGDADGAMAQAEATLEQLRVSAGFTQEEWDVLLNSFGLTKEQLELSAFLKDLDEANQKIGLLNQAIQTGEPVTIQKEALGEDAKSALMGLGADANDFVEFPDGTIRITIDDAEARARIDQYSTVIIPALSRLKADPSLGLNTAEFKPNLDQAAMNLAWFDGLEADAFADVDTSTIPQAVLDAMFQLGIIDSATPQALADLDWSKLSTEQQLSMMALWDLDGQTPKPKADLLKDPLMREADIAEGRVNSIKQTNPVKIDGTGVPLENTIGGLLARVWGSITIPIRGVWQKITGSPGGNAAGGRIQGYRTGGQLPAYELGDRAVEHNPGYRLPTTGPGTHVVDGFLGMNYEGMPIARVNAGEWVINARSSEKYHRELAAINSGTFPKLPGYAGGGVVLDDFARGVEGKPYVWGGVNWGDCSGAQSALARFSVGLDPFGGRFATGNQREALASMNFISGAGSPGDFRVGWYNGGPYGGHTTSTTPMGVNVEMGGARGDGQYGGGAQGVFGPGNNTFAHLPAEWYDSVFVPDEDELNAEITRQLAEEGVSVDDSTPASLRNTADSPYDYSKSATPSDGPTAMGSKNRETVALEDLPEEDRVTGSSISNYAGNLAKKGFVDNTSSTFERVGIEDDIREYPAMDLSNNPGVALINSDVQAIQYGNIDVNRETLASPEMHQLLSGRGKAYDPNFWNTDPTNVELQKSTEEAKQKTERQLAQEQKEAAAEKAKYSISTILGEFVGDFVEGQVADILNVFGVSDNPPWFQAWSAFQEAWHKRVHTAKERRDKIIQVQDAAAKLHGQYPDVSLNEIAPHEMPHMRPDESALTKFNGGGDENVVPKNNSYEERLGNRSNAEVVTELRAQEYDPEGGTEQWRPMVEAAMYENGMDASNPEHVDAVMAEMERSSGGNHLALPEDPAAKTGKKSGAGLMGVTDAQMKQHGADLDGDVSDPWTNINVAVRDYVKRNGTDPTVVWGPEDDKKAERRALGGIIGSAAGFLGGMATTGGVQVLSGIAGGLIKGFGGATQDTIRVLASAGEFMVNAFSAREAGPLLSAMNADPRFASAMQSIYDGHVNGSRTTTTYTTGENGDGIHVTYNIYAANVDEGMNRARMHERQLVQMLTSGR